MKYIYLIICLFFSSCGLEGLTEEGISIGFSNFTNTKFKSATMYLGAIKENQFIVTDSISSKGFIEIKTTENSGNIGFGYWNPSLKNVFNISNEGALYCEIENGLSMFFEPFNKKRFGKYNRFGGSSGIIILNSDNSFTYTSNNIEKQDFEVIK